VLLPPKKLLPEVGIAEPGRYHYLPLIGWVYRLRLELASDLLGEGPFDSTLEIGYGSGLFLPELARRSRRITGVDIHAGADAVTSMLTALGHRAELRRASILELPFDDAEFDAVICLSVLEHLRELDVAVGEIRRVLKPSGVAVLGFPVRNPVTDAFFRLLGYEPRRIHPSSHTEILQAIERREGLRIERVVRFPNLLPLPLAAYVACRARAA